LHAEFWDGMMLSRFTILDSDSNAARQAAATTEQLKAKRKTIDKPDLFIAATAVANRLYFDTLNVKHFFHNDKLLMLSH
jgi:tRNA(fMet)-specific endonuclease VapC